MIDYDSFSHCHLADVFYAIYVVAKELKMTIILSLLFEILSNDAQKSSFQTVLMIKALVLW